MAEKTRKEEMNVEERKREKGSSGSEGAGQIMMKYTMRRCARGKARERKDAHGRCREG